MHSNAPILVPSPAPAGGHTRRRPAASESDRLLLNPPPPDVRAQCAKDNERRMRAHAASLFSRRNHCD